MSEGTVFINNRTQAVRLPFEARFPENVKKVMLRVVGKERILSPAENTWHGFFLFDHTVSDDFINKDTDLIQHGRESFYF